MRLFEVGPDACGVLRAGFAPKRRWYTAGLRRHAQRYSAKSLDRIEQQAMLAISELLFNIERMVRPRDRAKEQRILASTLVVVERQGLAGLSMEAVAKEAGVAIGTLYVYFKSKEALLTRLYVQTKIAFARTVFAGVDSSSAVRPAFERMSHAYLQYLRKNRAEMLFMMQVRSAVELPRALRARVDDASAPLLALLERGKSEGLLKEIPTPLMIAFLQATLGELSAFVDHEARAVRAERYTQIARLAWDALKA